MVKLKIITDKTFVIDDVESINLLENLGSKKIDYQYSDPGDTEPKFNYFEIVINGVTKILAVSGKVEQWEVPETAQKITEYEKPEKGK